MYYDNVRNNNYYIHYSPANNTSRSLQSNYHRVNNSQSRNNKLKKQTFKDRNYLLKSRISELNGSNIKYNNQNQLFSQELLFLISNEQSNIQYFKNKILAEKEKAQKNFNNFKQQLTHIIDDLKVSIQAELDVAYKDFIHYYGQLKEFVVNFRKMRRQIIGEQIKGGGQYFSMVNSSVNGISNRDILEQIQKDAQLFKNQKVYNYLTDMQRQKLIPIIDLTKKIIILGSPQKIYYQQNQTQQYLQKVKNKLHKEINQGFLSLNILVQKCDKVIELEYKDREQQNMILKNQNLDSRNSQIQKLGPKTSQIHQFRNQKSDRNHSEQSNPYQLNHNRIKKNQQYSHHNNYNVFRPVSNIPQINNTSRHQNYHINHFYSQASQQKNRPLSQKKPLIEHLKLSKNMIGKNQQSLISEWIEQISLKQVNIIDGNFHSDILLCGIFINNGKYLATGSKDKTINIYDMINQKSITKLVGHNSSICCLATFGNYLVSGSDHGCSSVILWDINTWIIKSKLQAHSAAVTSILDLQDNQHFLTGSYDKRINLCTYKKPSILYSLPNKVGVSCLGLNADKSKIISSGLDNSLTIWKISRKDGNLQSIVIDRQIINNSLVCSLKTLELLKDYFLIGTKDGKIKLINLQNGETIKTFTMSNNSVIELITFERRNKPKFPLIVSCCSKQKALMCCKSDIGINSSLGMNGKVNVDYGCGIGPKIVINNNQEIVIINQSPTYKQILVYKIQIS